MIYNYLSFYSVKVKKKKLAIKTFHSTTEDAAKIATEANAKKLLIGHFSQRNPVKKYLNETKEIFPETIAAEDGLKIETIPTGSSYT